MFRQQRKRNSTAFTTYYLKLFQRYLHQGCVCITDSYCCFNWDGRKVVSSYDVNFNLSAF